MAISPKSLLVARPDRVTDHTTVPSRVTCVPSRYYDKDFVGSVEMTITSDPAGYNGGHVYYAHMNESEAARLLPTILACSEESARFDALSEHFAQMAESEIVKLLSNLLGCLQESVRFEFLHSYFFADLSDDEKISELFDILSVDDERILEILVCLQRFYSDPK